MKKRLAKASVLVPAKKVQVTSQIVAQGTAKSKLADKRISVSKED